MLTGNSFKPRPNSNALGTAGHDRFINKWMIALQKLV